MKTKKDIFTTMLCALFLAGCSFIFSACANSLNESNPDAIADLKTAMGITSSSEGGGINITTQQSKTYRYTIKLGTYYTFSCSGDIDKIYTGFAQSDLTEPSAKTFSFQVSGQTNQSTYWYVKVVSSTRIYKCELKLRDSPNTVVNPTEI